MKQNKQDEQAEAEINPRMHFEQEIAKISFQELQKFFAKGMLIKVSNDLELVEAALQIHADNVEQIQQWLDDETLVRAQDDHAKMWVANRTAFMAVTVAPWVLVQEII